MRPSEAFLETTVGPDSPITVAMLEFSQSFIHLPVVAMQQVRLPNLVRFAIPPRAAAANRVEKIWPGIGRVLHRGLNVGDGRAWERTPYLASFGSYLVSKRYVVVLAFCMLIGGAQDAAVGLSLEESERAAPSAIVAFVGSAE
jgi:hypothetical protein